MKILILTQWFQPEAHFKGLPLAKALEGLGHEVEVLTGFPNYPGGVVYKGYRVRTRQRELIDGIKVTRGALYPSHEQSAVGRILNYTTFAASTALLALTIRRPDVVYVYTPPMTATAAAIVLRLFRRAPYVVDVQDLWPDTLAATGMVRSKLLLRLVGAYTKFALRLAARVVVLSPGFKRAFEARGVKKPIAVIPNWAPPEIVANCTALPPPLRNQNSRLNIVFAGNMGQAQALDVVLDAAARLQARVPHAHFTMIGSGVVSGELRKRNEQLGLSNVSFLPPRHPQEMEPIFADADALLVHLRDDPLFSITIPSKTQAYLAVGRPILMGVRGDAAALVQEAGAGIAFEPENTEALIDAVEELARMSPEERAAMGRAGTAYYRDHLSFDMGIAALERELSAAVRR